MSTGKLSHLQMNVNAANLSFYRDFFIFLSWDPIYSDDVTESFNSNTLNIVAGICLPALIVGLGRISPRTVFAASSTA